MIYTGVQSSLTSRARINSRVAKGGHQIPDEDIFRRFDRSMSNLPKAMAMADRSFIFDNQRYKKAHQLLLKREKKETKRYVRSLDLPTWAKKALFIR